MKKLISICVNNNIDIKLVSYYLVNCIEKTYEFIY
jgi:hypothetical protein